MRQRLNCASCGAPIIWARTPRRRIPLDPEPHPTGNLAVRKSPLGVLHARVLGRDEEVEAGEVRFITHFATCPNRHEHRRPR
jgi:hypothetical protein